MVDLSSEERLPDEDSEDEAGEDEEVTSSKEKRPRRVASQCPFDDKIMGYKMAKLRTPTHLAHYNGQTNPMAHVNSFRAAMLYVGAADEVMCRAFPATLEGDAQLWFSDLLKGNISSFKQLEKGFTSYFATCRSIKRTSHCLNNIVQGASVPFKDFLIRFTKMARSIQGLKYEVALNYLRDNLRSQLFRCYITKKPPATMADLLARSAKYIAYEEVELSKKGKEVRKEDPE